MTTEKKAKAYDEAIERAKYTLTTDMDNSGHWAVKYIFPELAESEDERIRKEIIEFFDYCYDAGLFRDDDYDNQYAWRRWLEKQKEQKSVKEVDNLHNYLYGDNEKSTEENKQLHDIVIAELGKYNATDFWKAPWALDSTGLQYPLYFANLGAKWQKEQKPAEWSEEDDEKFFRLLHAGLYQMKCRIGRVEYDKAVERLKSLRSQSKQECSEEDNLWTYPYGKNETVDKLISIAECLEMDGDISFNGMTCEKCGAFLRDLARKEVENIIEWSEEDKNRLEEAIGMIEARGCWVRSDDAVKQVSDFLKSLRPQPHTVSIKDATKIKGWVAVDSDTVGNRRVLFFPQKPVRDLLTEYKYWTATRPNYEVIRLNPDAFPDLQWEDEPIEVELTIKPL